MDFCKTVAQIMNEASATEHLLWPDAVLGMRGRTVQGPVGIRVAEGKIAGVHAGRDLKDWIDAKFGPFLWERCLSRSPADGAFEESTPGREARLRRLGASALLPGFVNAHTHFEYTHLLEKLSGSEGFASWVRSILAAQSEEEEDGGWGSFEEGARLALASGTTCAMCITRAEVLSRLANASPIAGPRLFVLGEVLGFRPELAEERLGDVARHLDSLPDEVATAEGLAPHAPYSTSPALYRACADLAERKGWPVTTHLAESRDELDFLREKLGALRDILEEKEMWTEEGWETVVSPLDYLEGAGALRGGMTSVVHGNYLGREDARRLADLGVPIIYCPGASEFFGVEAYPLEIFLEEGIEVALGTDSLASAPTLDMLEIIRLAARRHPSVPPRDLLEMATVRGARAFGISDTGRIELGCRADLLALRFDRLDANDPWSSLLEGAVLERTTYLDGDAVT